MKHFFRVTWRNIRKNGAYSLVNLVGLAIGVACFILILLWVESEVSFNHQFAQRNRIYVVMDNQTYSGHTFTFGATPGILGPALQAQIPGILRTVRSSWEQQSLFTLGHKAIFEKGNYVDSSFFPMLAWPFAEGSPSRAFSGIHSVVISQSMAARFFGKASALGKVLQVDNGDAYMVSGVIRDLPVNSSMSGDWFIPFENHMKKNPWLYQWGNNGILTYVELKDRVDPARINPRIYGFIQTKDATAEAKIFLFPMSSWHLYDHFENGKSAGGQIKYVRLFTLIGWIILIIACINFMNLATARSEYRAREVGIRKTLGSGRGKLIWQFILEAMVMSFLSLGIAILIVWLLLPAFNQLTGRALGLRLNYLPHLAGLFAIALISGLAAGSYPAFYLSSFRPVKVLKGVRLSPNAGLIRKGLVIIQFCVSTILIICTVIIFQQVRHGKDRDLGMDRQNLIDVPLRGDMANHFEVLHQSLLATGLVKDATFGENQVFSLGSNGGGFSWPGKDPSKDVLITEEAVSPGYVRTMGMHLASGRVFYPDAKLDSNDIIINESLARLMGKEGVVGHYLVRSPNRWRIVGIVDDFVYNNMYQAASPLVFFCYPSVTSWLFVRFMPGVDPEKGIAAVGKVVRGEQPAYPFEYYFVDRQFDELFKSETLIGTLAAVFASLAVFISCLGLLGLAAFSAERRTREIGIRKVLGASLSGLLGLLSSEFLKLVAMACLAALPISWWIMHNWLENYDYRISIQWWVFVATVAGALGITLLTVTFQAWRAAAVNPTKSLRAE